jgi:hypothetical protein
MDLRADRLESRVTRLDALLVSAVPGVSANARAAAERWRADAAALRFHLRRTAGGGGSNADAPPVVVLLGGTGTGKSTLANRLLGANLSAASFRRTFTAGPVALARAADALPAGWLGVEPVVATPEQLPAKGQPGSLVVVPVQGDLTDKLTLVDTPDLDGDQPAHHAQADRAFRWAEAVLFLVTPEKYQMTELLPYYRLARRYGLPALHVMNKCEEQAVLDDYRAMLGREVLEGGGQGSGFRGQGSGVSGQSSAGAEGAGATATATPGGGGSRVFAVARDDSAYQPPKGEDLAGLRSALADVPTATRAAGGEGLRVRARDLMGRFADQVLAPMREDRREADRLVASLRAMEAPAVGVDVNPLTQQLQRRLQQRSILYLMGPGRVLDRVRQAPGLIARLPRVAWDYLSRGELSAASLNAGGNGREREVPEFRAILADQFAVLQSRIDDALRSTPAGERWLAQEPTDPATPPTRNSYASAKLPTEAAAAIADEELADLKQWLEQRWNATPRDTKAIQTLLKYLPGGNKLVQWTEAAPYLLTIALVTHGAVFGHIDLVVLGGYGLATWISERLSNEVTARTRATNARIADRFAALAHDQIERACAWLDRQAPPAKMLERLERAAEEVNEVVQA